jgi:(E)-4-hydroxy-3-methylbut-2-enyl-diphosphate synthase
VEKSITLHFFLPHRAIGSHTSLESAQAASELGVSHVWLDVQSSEDIPFINEISRTLSIGVVASAGETQLIEEVLKIGVSGIAVRPFFVKELLGYRDLLLAKGCSVYLCMGSFENSVAEPALDQRTPQEFLSRLNELARGHEALKKAGVEDLFVHLTHPDPVVLFNASRMMKERYGARHIVSLSPHRGREKNLLVNALRLGSLFYEGIGEALLLQASSWERFRKEGVQEAVELSKRVLGSCRLFPTGYRIISCPTCGRCRMDLLKMTVQIDRKLKALVERYNQEGKKLEDVGGIAVAVMGCNVNGPGEARNADIGIAGRKNKTGILFKNGEAFKTLPENRLVDELMAHTEALIDCKFKSSRC